jgi:hypothetical protein
VEIFILTHKENFSTFIPEKTSSYQLKGMMRSKPLQNAPFCPISVSGSNFNPQNTQCIPAVKIFAFLELEQN